MEVSDMQIGVIGNGVLGRAVVRGLVEHVRSVRVHDANAKLSTHTLAEVAKGSHIIFVCVPTPESEDGSCDTSIVTRCVDELVAYAPHAPEEPLIVIRSTVPVGYTDDLCARLLQEHRFSRIVHNPEFLTARCALVDYHTPSRHIIGVPWAAQGCSGFQTLQDLYAGRFPNTPTYVMSSDESEIVKLACNSFFAAKVAFFNGIHALCGQTQSNYESVLRGMLSDGRIAHSHTQVPGPDGKLGFGGTCLPKDLASLVHTLRERGIGAFSFLSDIAETNRATRHD
jgi:UDPglucose 6-dehydrogenase